MDVSICITTYNHEKYIEECLMSIFAQDFSGQYEIIIGNDNSSDQTAAIIQKISKEHPKGNLIKYFNNVPNLGYVKNTLHTFHQAKGKYISVLDGDDYFIDPLKIQKQFDFLENNPDFSAVGGDSRYQYEDQDKPEHLFSNHLDEVLKKEDLLNLKIFQTSTFFFRKEILKPDFPTDIVSADRCMYLLAGCFGKVKVLPDVLSAYRQFAASLSKNVSYETMKKDFAIIPFIKKYGNSYKTSALKTYFFYTLMTYPNSITKKQFNFAALNYLYYNTLSKFSWHPLILYSVLKWGKHLVKQKFDLKKQNGIFAEK